MASKVRRAWLRLAVLDLERAIHGVKYAQEPEQIKELAEAARRAGTKVAGLAANGLADELRRAYDIEYQDRLRDTEALAIRCAEHIESYLANDDYAHEPRRRVLDAQADILREIAAPYLDETSRIYSSDPIETLPPAEIIGLARYLPRDCKVLLVGETGVGKEFVANGIHRGGKGKGGGRFIAVNCAGLGDRVEAELFGYRKGSFTGATQDAKGLAEEAAGGTLFLDELDKLPAGSMGTLLRFLQDREIRPLGGTPQIVDVRVVCATNRLDSITPEDIARFDETFPITPLRHRKNEIVELAESFFSELRSRPGNQRKRFTKAERAAVAESAYEWPMNVRQLKKAIERAARRETILTATAVLREAQAVELLTRPKLVLP